MKNWIKLTAILMLLAFPSICLASTRRPNETVYYVDPSNADQGVTGNGSTIKDLATAIGTSTKATLVFPHSGSGVTTAYIVASGVTISPNIKLEVEEGAVFRIDTGQTLVIEGAFVAGLNQAFNCVGTGKVIIKQVPVNIVWFGADRTGVEDCTAAMQSALWSMVNNVYSLDGGIIEYPTGIYNFTQNNAWMSPGSTTAGFKIKGAGKNKTMIKLTPSGTSMWVFQNPNDAQISSFVDVSDIIFIAADSNANGFSFNQDQSWLFDNCRFQSFATAFQLGGSAGGSEHRFNNCKFNYITGKVFSYSNPQAVNIELYGCDLENIYGDTVYVNALGGGSFKAVGGSWILNNVSGASTYLLNIAGGAGTVGPGNGDFTFNNIKFEINSAYNYLVKSASLGQSFMANFNECNFTTTIGSARNLIDIYSDNYVGFTECYMPAILKIKFNSDVNSYAQYNAGGRVNIERCLINSVPTITRSGAYGTLRMRNNIRHGSINASQYKFGIALDTDSGWETTSQFEQFGELIKTAKLMSYGYWPTNSDVVGSGVTLPVNSLIKNIYVYKPAQGVSTTAYEIHVGTSDRATIYGESGSAWFKSGHTIAVTNDVGDEVNVGSDVNKRFIRLWCTGGDAEATQSGGYAIVEYY